MSDSRYLSGGFGPRFVVTRVDGKPCRPGARYMVLDGSGADPHATVALRAYADSVRGENPTLAADLDRMLAGDWPAALAQHGNATEFAVTMNGLFWNADIKSFTSVPTRYPTHDEAVEAAQEDAKLPPDAGWKVVPAN